jgi:hypothetical protein
MDLRGKIEVKKQDLTPFAHLLFYPKNQNSYLLLDLTKGETA